MTSSLRSRVVDRAVTSDPWMVYPFPRLSPTPLPTGYQHPDRDHLIAAEIRIAAVHLKLQPGDLNGPPRGLIVGHSPGPTGRLPLFPWPARSSGARLAAFGGLSPADYLGRFRRVNMFDTEADASRAKGLERALAIRQLLRDDLAWRRKLAAEAMIAGTMQHGDVADHQVVTPLRVLACSVPVAEALEIPIGTGIAQLDDDHHGIGIPHPSGLNRQTNRPNVQAMMSAAVRWAAGYLVRWG